MKTGPYRVGIIGAAGAVGQQLIASLEERSFPVRELRLLATKRSAGARLLFRGEQHTVRETTDSSLNNLDIVFLAAGTSASKHWAPIAVNRGALVIDKSNAFRADCNVPLIVPEVNAEEIWDHHGIISSPNCSTIQLVMVLKPIHDRLDLQRVVVSTYQSVSGTGRAALDELRIQASQVLANHEVQPRVYPRQIAFNLLPQIGEFAEADYTEEELKLVNETRRILGLPELQVSATAVRVPVFVGHSQSVLVETRKAASADQLSSWLKDAPGVVVQDDPVTQSYPTPVEAAGTDLVNVGRIRRDLSSERGFWLWIAADNLRKGAATNALHIAELLCAQEGSLNDARH